jgi:y4mF family transcriptional regulator
MAATIGATIAREDRSEQGSLWFARPVRLSCERTGKSHKRVYDQALAACAMFKLVLEGKPVPTPVAPEAALVPEKAIAPPAPAMLDDPARTHDVPEREQGPATAAGIDDARPLRAKRAGPGAPVADGGISSVAQLGEAVRQARRHKGLSQQEVATAAGVGRRFIVELEGGKATAEIGLVLAVCRAAGVTLTVAAG